MERMTPFKRVLRDEGRRQDWLAERTGISQADISRMAVRGMRPTEDQAQRIAEALGRDLSELFPELGQVA